MLNEDEYLNVNCKNFSQKFVQFVAIVSLITFDTFVFMNTMFVERFGKICINPIRERIRTKEKRNWISQ